MGDRRKTTWMVAGAAVLIGLAGCSESPGPEARTGAAGPVAAAPAASEYRDPTLGYRITPPPGWRTGSPAGGSTASAQFFNPVPDSAGGRAFAVNMNVVVSPTAATLDANVAGAKQQLPGLLADYRLVDDRRITSSSGEPAHLLGTGYTREGIALQNLQLVAVVRGQSYVVTVTAPAATFQRYADSVNRSLGTFSTTL